MAEPWEIDPTTTDTDGAGTEGGAVGGDSAGDTTLPPPLQPQPDIDRTNLFEPTGASTPYPPEDDSKDIELSNMNLDEIEFDPDDIPLLTDFMSEDEKKTRLARAFQFIKDKFPKVDLKKLGPTGFSKKQGNALWAKRR